MTIFDKKEYDLTFWEKGRRPQNKNATKNKLE